MIKHVSFDMWGTIIKGNPKFKEELAKRLLAYVCMEFNHKVTLDNVRIAYKKATKFSNDCNCAIGTSISQDQIIFLLLSDLAKPEDIKFEHIRRVSRMVDTVFLENPCELIDEAGMRIVKHYCDKLNVSTSILSNTNLLLGSHLDIILKRTALFDMFKFRLYSDQTGRSKPGAEAYYDLKMSLKKVNSSECLHVGDCIVNDGKAVKHGMNFLHVYGDSGNTIRNVCDYLM